MRDRSAPHRAWTAEPRLALQRGEMDWCVVRSRWPSLADVSASWIASHASERKKK